VATSQQGRRRKSREGKGRRDEGKREKKWEVKRSLTKCFIFSLRLVPDVDQSG